MKKIKNFTTSQISRRKNNMKTRIASVALVLFSLTTFADQNIKLKSSGSLKAQVKKDMECSVNTVKSNGYAVIQQMTGNPYWMYHPEVDSRFNISDPVFIAKIDHPLFKGTKLRVFEMEIEESISTKENISKKRSIFRIHLFYDSQCGSRGVEVVY